MRDGTLIRGNWTKPAEDSPISARRRPRRAYRVATRSAPGSSCPRPGMPPLPSRRSRRGAVMIGVAIALVAGAVLGHEATVQRLVLRARVRRAPPTTIPKVPSPLTGEAVTAAVADRPVVIIKVDNSRPSAAAGRAERGGRHLRRTRRRLRGAVPGGVPDQRSNRRRPCPLGSLDRRRDRRAARWRVRVLGRHRAIHRAKVQATGVKTVVEGDSRPRVCQARRQSRGRTPPTRTPSKLRTHAESAAAPPPAVRAVRAWARRSLPRHPASYGSPGMRVVFGSLTTADWTWDDDQAPMAAEHQRHGPRARRRQPSRRELPDPADRAVPVDAVTPTGPAPASTRRSSPDRAKRRSPVTAHAVDAKWNKPSQRAVTTYTERCHGRSRYRFRSGACGCRSCRPTA